MPSETERNKEVVRGFIERGFVEAARGNSEALNSYVAPHYHLHTERAHDHTAVGVEGLKDYAREAGIAFKDFTLSVDHIIGEGDMVAVHWVLRGQHHGKHRLAHVGEVEPTGRAMEVAGIGIYRVEKGKIVEGWLLDNLHVKLLQAGTTLKPARHTGA
jgi:predicted ester cyclase